MSDQPKLLRFFRLVSKIVIEAYIKFSTRDVLASFAKVSLMLISNVFKESVNLNIILYHDTFNQRRKKAHINRDILFLAIVGTGRFERQTRTGGTSSE